MAAGEEGVLSGLGGLQPYLVSAVDELTASLLHRAISDFNDWLVGACSRHPPSASQMPCDRGFCWCCFCA